MSDRRPLPERLKAGIPKGCRAISARPHSGDSHGMYRLPKLSSLEAPLPHERLNASGSVAEDEGRRRNSSMSHGSSSSRHGRARPQSDDRAVRRRASKQRGGAKDGRGSKYTRGAKATKAADLLYLVPRDKEEARMYKSVLVFCDVKLREGAAKRRLAGGGSGGGLGAPDAAATAACCHAIDELSGPLWAPFSKVMRKLRDELLVALYSDYVEPTAAVPYVQRVPYHALAEQLRRELGELGEQLADAQRQLAMSLASRSELEDMVLAARVAKLDTGTVPRSASRENARAVRPDTNAPRL